MSIQNEYLNGLMERVIQRDPAEPEFHQAVREVLTSLAPVANARPELISEGVMDCLVEPERVIKFRVPWEAHRRCRRRAYYPLPHGQKEVLPPRQISRRRPSQQAHVPRHKQQRFFKSLEAHCPAFEFYHGALYRFYSFAAAAFQPGAQISIKLQSRPVALFKPRYYPVDVVPQIRKLVLFFYEFAHPFRAAQAQAVKGQRVFKYQIVIYAFYVFGTEIEAQHRFRLQLFTFI